MTPPEDMATAGATSRRRSVSPEGRRFLDLLRQGIRQTGMGGTRVLVACSGGPDSLSLLLGLWLLSEEAGISLEAGTVDHGLRTGSRRDALYVRRVAQALKIPFHQRSLDLKARPAPADGEAGGPASESGRRPEETVSRSQGERRGGGVEALARRARYEALESMADEADCDAIATAHTLEDQAETLLMRLGSGCGLKGARGILDRNGRVKRPMLAVSRKQVAAFLKDFRLKGRTDPTNASDDFTRNRVRRLVLPALEKALGPMAATCLARFCAVAAMGDEALDYQADEAWKRLGAEASLLPFDGLFDDPAGDLPDREMDGARDAEFAVDDLAAMPAEIRFRILNRAVAKAGGRLDYDGFLRLDDALGKLSPQRVQLTAGVEATVRYGRLKVTAPRSSHESSHDGDGARRLDGEADGDFLVLPVPEGPGGTWSATWRDWSVHVKRLAPLERVQGEGAVGIAMESLSMPEGSNGPDGDGGARRDSSLVLRFRRPGDVFRPKGAGGGKKLKAFLIDAKVPLEMRDDLPLLAAGGSKDVLAVFGLPGLRPGAGVLESMGPEGGVEISVRKERGDGCSGDMGGLDDVDGLGILDGIDGIGG